MNEKFTIEELKIISGAIYYKKLLQGGIDKEVEDVYNKVNRMINGMGREINKGWVDKGAFVNNGFNR